jgi:predicted ATPase/class 3 adenylate cyclase
MFCDLVGSTALSTQLDPEELRELIRAYQRVSAEVISRLGGYIAQYLGDGLLVYFGYPTAHEDDAARAVRAGLEILTVLQQAPPLTSRLNHAPLHIRIGIHTGQVVISDVGERERAEQLALGETPNLAARIQGEAAPDTILLSAMTHQLVQGLFECWELGFHQLKGFTTPFLLYQVERESAARSRFDVAVQRGLTPLVGREHEVGLLTERWERAKQAEGQVILLSGEPGIGKSRLARVMRERTKPDGALRLTLRCSPYHQNSAFHPVIDLLQWQLQFLREDAVAEKVRKLERAAKHLGAMQLKDSLPMTEVIPLIASLLSLPHPQEYPPLHLSPQRQKQKIQEAFVAWLVKEAERRPLFCTWEDVHWADPSSLELLNLLIDQAPTARIYLLLTFRPEFTPTWGLRSHLSQLTLSRLGRGHATQMIEHILGGKSLLPATVQQIITKTDGVPLFVEEFTRMVAESDPAAQQSNPSALPSFDIPTTLRDALMARLDRLATAKEIAQLGAAIGREFSYELLLSVSPWDEATLQRGLSQLVEADLVHQHGLPPQVRYVFRHALIQDVAYQALLKSQRQYYHQKIAQLLEERFVDIKETQPELLAHHYTEAGLIAEAIPYWRKAGERAGQRSAYTEATSHLKRGLALLATLPESSARTQQELLLHIALGAPVHALKGYAAPEARTVYTRARELCRELGDPPQLSPVLWGLWIFHVMHREFDIAKDLGRQLLQLAQRVGDPDLFLPAHHSLWTTFVFHGDLTSAQVHLDQGLRLYTPEQHHEQTFLYGGHDPGVCCRVHAGFALWLRGYPDQALQKSQEAVALAQRLAHPHTLAWASSAAAMVHLFRQEKVLAQEQAETTMTFAKEQQFPIWTLHSTIVRGWALAAQGQGESGVAQIREAMASYQEAGAELWQSQFLALLADAYGRTGRIEEGLVALADGVTIADTSGEQFYLAELHRLQGELTLQKARARNLELGISSTAPQTSNRKSQVPRVVEQEAERYFHKAIEIARRQQAKSLELRTAMSLGRLWKEQNKRMEAQQLLGEISSWFTEGFDTADLQQANLLLTELRN